MSNLYTLTQKIHEILPQINQKYGLDLNLSYENSYFICNDGDNKIFSYRDVFDRIDAKIQTSKDFIPAIQTAQIRQILIGLKDVLGDNADYKEERYNWVKNRNDERFIADNHKDCVFIIDYKIDKIYKKSQAEALCQRWLDGLEPLFDREPEKVLQELVEILENLLN